MQITVSELSAFIAMTYANQGLPPGTTQVITPKRYVAAFTALTAGTTQSEQVQIQANGDFFLTDILFSAYAESAGTPSTKTRGTAPAPNCTVLITDSGSDQQWYTNGNADINTVWQNMLADASMDEPYPRVVNGRSTLTVTIANAEASQAYNINVTFAGVLVTLLGN